MTDPVVTEKVDPETLVLRAKPRRAVRFRRNLMIGVGAVGALLLAGVTWLGLSPPLIKAVEVAEKSQDLAKRVRPPVETLGRLPKTYADAPVLGPPLPGDLGGPLLEAERDNALDVTDSATDLRSAGRQTAPSSEASQPAVSGLFVAVAMRLSPPQSPALAEALGKASNTPTISVPAGTILAATLITGLNSDLPGVVLAQITEAVFDGKGQRVVIPAGSRLIGRYERVSMARQARINVRWETLVLPAGEALTLTDAVAADGAGYVGLADHVDYHPGTLAKGVGLSTMLALADTRSEGGDDLSGALREAAGRTFNQAGQRIVQQAIDMPATITVRPGWPVRIILVKGLALPVEKGGATNG
ncbi:TrbI/VirB10 family protein [Asticcacaulis sp. YBE204]|uniref:TrbI/VirB10 family protein n=1 Tax=Asticcacaulis sp. YBE204 TaxID=1282363 RepID=UPI0003C4054C|nr:TrbI/VirB10 family protein [Asticcacaulis sp. YBE204]ESQ78715.1 hypothetical protein AEYBE204_12075 [Asticcacaulis sp. YBE204]